MNISKTFLAGKTSNESLATCQKRDDHGKKKWKISPQLQVQPCHQHYAWKQRQRFCYCSKLNQEDLAQIYCWHDRRIELLVDTSTHMLLSATPLWLSIASMRSVASGVIAVAAGSLVASFLYLRLMYYCKIIQISVCIVLWLRTASS